MPPAPSSPGGGLPAKLVGPGTVGVLRRERLLRRIEAADAARIVWIRAQAGAGKTLLAGSFIETRRLPSLWYQVDPGDADPGTFFYYLGLAARRLTGRLRHLPLLTAEYRLDPAGFARNFARAMFDRLPSESVLVLDNFQELPSGSATTRLFAIVLEQIPATMRVLITSRSDPPSELARLVAHSSIGILDNADLRLTLDETRELLADAGIVDAAATEQLHRRTDGWAAGTALLARHLGPLSVTSEVDTLDESVLAGYFTSEVLDRIAPTTRDLLFRTAWLPQFTAEMAEAASGIANAASQLSSLSRQHGFVTYSRGAGRIYRYHDLFRAFLIERASQTFAVGETAGMVSRCAAVLEAQAPSEAFNLHLQMRDYEALLRLIEDRADALLAQGRGQMLADWLDRLPNALVDADPWLTLWGGLARLQLGLHAGRPMLLDAYRRFEENRDARGVVVAATVFVESVLVTGAEMQAIDPCIDSLQRRLRDPEAFASLEFELRVIAAVGVGLSIRRPADPQLAVILARARQLIALDADPNVRTAAANFLIFFDCWFGIIPATADVPQVMNEVLRDERLAPINRLLWHWWIAQYWFLDGDLSQGLADLHSARELAARHGLDYFAPILALCRACGLQLYGDAINAKVLLRQVEVTMKFLRPVDTHAFHFIASLVEHDLGDPEEAMAAAVRSVEHSQALGSHISTALCQRQLAVLLADRGREAESVELISASFRSFPQTPYFAYEAGVLYAYASLQAGRKDAARVLLAACPLAGRRHGHPNFVFVSPRFVGRIAALAFEFDIDAGHFRALVQRLRIQPPEDVDEEGSLWPWPIRIHTMGRFGIEVSGEFMHSSGKPQKRPLELLKALIAQGSHDVPIERLIDQLWPDTDGDAAQNAFNLALHRLRRLLREESALVLREGRLSIDFRRVWVDARALERLAERVTTNEAIDPERAAEELLNLYVGPFLNGDDGNASTVWRDRLRSRFLRAMLALSARLVLAERHEAAIHDLQRAIEMEPAAEPLHRALLECLIRQGRHSEALQAYRRCEMLLAATLDLLPSRETHALGKRIEGLR